MASFVESLSESRTATAPISAHPAFPAIVALWFAALLGLGSLVLPVALIERLVTVTHFSSIVSAAEPPLGFTARAGIALGASIAGALVGLWLARKVAAAATPEPRARGFALASDWQCRPISAPDELGDDGFDPASASAPAQKRRSLAIVEDDGPSSYLQAVPLPGQSTDASAELAPFAAAPLSEPVAAGEPVAETDREPLELGAFVAPDGEEEPSVRDDAEDELEALRQQIHTLDAPRIERPAFAVAAQANDEPLPFAAPSLRRPAVAEFDEEEQADVTQDENDYDAFDDESSSDESLGQVPFVAEPMPRLAVVEDFSEPEVDDRPVEELGLVQLAARLGASLEKRRAWLAQRPSAGPAPAPAPVPFADGEDFEAARPEEAARAMADFFGSANSPEPAEVTEDFAMTGPDLEFDEGSAEQALPAQLRSVSFDGDDEFDEDAIGASFSLPLGGVSAQANDALDREGEDFDEEEPDDAEYSSLLAMKNPFARQQEFVRIDEPEETGSAIEPAVTFPSVSPAKFGAASDEPGGASAARPFDPPKKPAESVSHRAPATPRDPAEAERSLRDALATLQRMSGAA